MVDSGDADAERDRLVHELVAQLGSARYRRVDTQRYSVFHLEPPPGADYTFLVWVYDNGEPQLSARLLNGPEDQYFWGRHFELPDYPSAQSRTTAFLEILGQVMTCRTRITQTKGWLFVEFGCHADVAGQWVSIGGHAAGRWIGGIPETGQKQVEYFSPAVR